MTVAETKETVEAAKDFLERHDVHTVECMFADTWGIPRGKRLSAKHFVSTAGGTGFAVANVALTWDMHGVIFPTSFVNDETGYPDMHVVPDLSTLRVAGWRDGTAFCICDTIDPTTHESIPLDSRAILRRSVERVQAQGFEPVERRKDRHQLLAGDFRHGVRREGAGRHGLDLGEGRRVAVRG